MRKWLSRYTSTEEKLKEVGINLAVQDNEQRAHRLLARTCVSEELQRTILTTAGHTYDYARIRRAMKILFPLGRAAPAKVRPRRPDDIRQATQPVQGRVVGPANNQQPGSRPAFRPEGSRKPFVKRAHVTEHDDAADDGEATSGAEGDDGSVTVDELAEVLTVTAQKLKGRTLGRKWTAKDTKKPPASTKPKDHKRTSPRRRAASRASRRRRPTRSAPSVTTRGTGPRSARTANQPRRACATRILAVTVQRALTSQSTSFSRTPRRTASAPGTSRRRRAKKPTRTCRTPRRSSPRMPAARPLHGHALDPSGCTPLSSRPRRPGAAPTLHPRSRPAADARAKLTSHSAYIAARQLRYSR